MPRGGRFPIECDELDSGASRRLCLSPGTFPTAKNESARLSVCELRRRFLGWCGENLDASAKFYSQFGGVSNHVMFRVTSTDRSVCPAGGRACTILAVYGRAHDAKPLCAAEARLVRDNMCTARFSDLAK